MASAGISIKYKFANGYILKEESKLSPYVYAGAGINRLTDRMKMNCIVPGDYYSLNIGGGFKYNVTERFNIGFNLSIGRFQSDELDFIEKGGSDVYMQNILFLGVNL